MFDRKIEEMIEQVQKPARYIGGEMNTAVKAWEDAEVHFAFCFPDTYEVAMSHLGMKILYAIINAQPWALCERVCMPWIDMKELMEQNGVPLNPAIFKNGEWVKTYGTTTHPLRYTYALSRGPLQDAAGANAIWNITNVTRSDRRYHYMTAAYAEVASKDADVQRDFYTLFPAWNKTGDVAQDIYNYLMNKELPVEMSDEDYVDFMVWHRGLAVPAARNLDDADVKRGKALFTEIGCATCHRPTWTTGDDVFTDPNGFFADGDSRLPRYPNQKIWPYSDMVQHRLFMVNDIRTGWCRTTPLWGRGLSEKCTGASDRLHDCRARTVIEAIMWHGAAQSDARWSVEKFRTLSKDDRDAVVEFIESI